MEFIWGENIFLKFLINLCKRSLILEGRNIVFRKFHTRRELTGASLTHGDQALSSSLVLQMSNKEDFKDFEAMTETKQTFPPSKLVTFRSG